MNELQANDRPLYLCEVREGLVTNFAPDYPNDVKMFIELGGGKGGECAMVNNDTGDQRDEHLIVDYDAYQ